MLRLRFIAVCLCVLAVWTQILLPVAAMSMERPADPFGVICGRGAAEPGNRQAPAHHQHHHDCCLLCHADLGAAPPTERPAFIVFDYPIASPLRWRVVRMAPSLAVPRRESLPRGPPRFV